MKTEQRLTSAYRKAKIMNLDADSKYIIFSDCHRSDGSRSDEFTRNENIFLYAMTQYYNKGFTYIEAGDGDELWEHPKFHYIRKAHYPVYDLLKKFYDADRLEIIYGNHNIYLKKEKYLKHYYYSYYNDAKEMTMDFLNGMIPHESIVLRHTDTQQDFLVLHGHQGDFFNDQIWGLSMFSLKFMWRYLHAIGANSPTSPVKNITRQHKIEKNYNKWIEKYSTPIICGHTHRYKFPHKDEPPYFNTGCCVYPSNITGIEIEHNQIMVVRWKVIPDEDGILKIERFVIRGPLPLSTFAFSQK